MNITQAKYLSAILFFITFQNYSQNIVSAEDLNLLLGEWKGSLTYNDYKTNKPFTMPANLLVEKGKDENQLILKINYPKEPNANSKDKIKISKNGTQINKREIKSRKNLADGITQITTEYLGKDDNLKAMIRNIYLIGKAQFSIRKEVKHEGSDEWMLRNTYEYYR